MKARLLQLLCCSADNKTHGGPDPSNNTDLLKWNFFRARCIASLLKWCTPQETVIPPPRWRKRYGRWVPIGHEGIEALSELLLEQLNEEERQSAKENNNNNSDNYSSAGRDSSGSRRRALTLDLHGLRIGDDGVRALLPFIARDSNIVELVLSGNNITDKGVEALLGVLAVSRPPLQVFSISNNPLTPRGIINIIKLFTSSSSGVPKELRVGRSEMTKVMKPSTGSDYYFSVDMKDDFVEFFHASYENTLSSFTYSGYGGTDFNAQIFGCILYAAVCNSKLDRLVLHNCYNSFPCNHGNEEEEEASLRSLATPLGMAAEGLCSATTVLKSLELQIPLSVHAVTQLAKGISGATLLSRLSLRGCNLDAESLRIIGESLQSNRTLVFLDLSYQSPEVAHPLCNSHRPSLLLAGQMGTSVYSSCRPLQPIFAALHANRTLQELIVLGVDIIDSDVEELCACVERSGNHVIRHVQHTSLHSQPLLVKLERLLGRNRSRSHSDVHAGGGGTTTMRHSDPKQLPENNNNNNEKCVGCKQEIQREESLVAPKVTKKDGKINGVHKIVAKSPEIKGTTSDKRKINKGNNNADNTSCNSNFDCKISSRISPAVATSGDSNDSNFPLTPQSSELYSPREHSQPAYIVS